MIDLTPYRQYGDYVTPYDMTAEGGPPRGFVHDGASGVSDLEHEWDAKHDWWYLTGSPKMKSDFGYAKGYWRRGRYGRAIMRWTGLTFAGWWAYYINHRRAERETPRAERIAARIIPLAKSDTTWNWLEVSRTWLLADLHQRWPDAWADFSPDDC